MTKEELEKLNSFLKYPEPIENKTTEKLYEIIALLQKKIYLQILGENNEA